MPTASPARLPPCTCQRGSCTLRCTPSSRPRWPAAAEVHAQQHERQPHRRLDDAWLEQRIAREIAAVGEYHRPDERRPRAAADRSQECIGEHARQPDVRRRLELVGLNGEAARPSDQDRQPARWVPHRPLDVGSEWLPSMVIGIPQRELPLPDALSLIAGKGIVVLGKVPFGKQHPVSDRRREQPPEEERPQRGQRRQRGKGRVGRDAHQPDSQVEMGLHEVFSSRGVWPSGAWQGILSPDGEDGTKRMKSRRGA